MEYINLKERRDILKLGFKDADGNILKDERGKEVFLEFDLGSVDLPLNYNKCINQMNQAKKNLKAKFIIIDKKQNHKGKQLLSSNEEEKIKAVRQFYKEMEQAMDLFLGSGGTKKFLNGKSPYFEMWDDIDEMLKPYYPRMNLKVTDMENRIKEKYKLKESDTLTNE